MTTAQVTISVPLDGLAIAAPLPEFISQRNIEAVMGIPARVFLETIREGSFPLAVHRLGKLRLVDRASFAAWVRSRPAQTSAASLPAPANDAPQRATTPADAVLAELDCERVPQTSPLARKAR